MTAWHDQVAIVTGGAASVEAGRGGLTGLGPLSTPNCPNFSRRFWSQVHVTTAYQKALDWRPERPPFVVALQGL